MGKKCGNAKRNDQKKSLLSNVGKIQKQNVKNDDLRQGNMETHTKRYNGVSATKEVSKKQNGPNEDY
jgi:hypothetical protein